MYNQAQYFLILRQKFINIETFIIFAHNKAHSQKWDGSWNREDRRWQTKTSYFSLPTSNLKKEHMKKYTLSEMEDKYIGEKGTPARDTYEYELKMELLGRMIKATRKEKHMTQAELGKII